MVGNHDFHPLKKSGLFRVPGIEKVDETITSRFMQGNGGFFAESTTVDGSEIRRSPDEVASFSHYLHGFMSFQTVIGWVFGISSSINSSNTSNTNNFIIRKIPSFQQPPPPPDGPPQPPNLSPGWSWWKNPKCCWRCQLILLSRRRILEVRTGRGWWEGRSVGTLRYATATWNNPPIHGGFCGKWNHMLGGGFTQIFFMFIPIFWANDPIWRAYFSKGLVQPPTRYVLETLLKKMGW